MAKSVSADIGCEEALQTRHRFRDVDHVVSQRAVEQRFTHELVVFATLLGGKALGELQRIRRRRDGRSKSGSSGVFRRVLSISTFAELTVCESRATGSGEFGESREM